jgi:fatty-acid desaturase
MTSSRHEGEPAPAASSAILHDLLEPPRYGWERDGRLYKPTARELWSEVFHRINLFRDRKNWLPFTSWFWTLGLVPFVVVFLTQYRSVTISAFGFVYSMFWLGTHGTVWLHRYGTHRAFTFSHPAYRFVCRNLSIKIVPEEIYIVSHRVHHELSEKPGDPYNVHGGGLYCFLADINHQPINRNLSQDEYRTATRLMNHTGVRINSYAQYRKWGSIAHPLTTSMHFALNWTFWYAMFWLIGGHAMATGLFAWCLMWAIGVRTFNFAGHGSGKDRRRPGIDFNTGDIAINQVWPGFVSGEWHSNHHLYPNGVRAGFLPWQLDLAWLFIRFYALIGGIATQRDYTRQFYDRYYLPWQGAHGGQVPASTEPAQEGKSGARAPG